MAYLHSYLASANKIIELYNGKIPLSAFLKHFFSMEKKYGSRDRKAIAGLCYNYFRISNVLQDQSLKNRLLASHFIFSNSESDFFLVKWNEQISVTKKEKAAIAGIDTHTLFPFNDELSPGVDVTAFNESLLVQPDLFIRLRPGKERNAKDKLSVKGIMYNTINNNCLAFANGTKLEKVIDINHEAVIQDATSQRVAEMFEGLKLPAKPTVWDCCAASGGKSIMAYDKWPEINLTVSDIRQSIIHNLQKRFSEAGIKNYRSIVADVTNADNLQHSIGKARFYLIICDAPCSGSGTWGRTPEQLTFFKKEEIIRYSSLQKKIALNAVNYLAKEGYFLYITCSVFKQENEDVVEFIVASSSARLIKQQLLVGYESNADTMFAALFQLA